MILWVDLETTGLDLECAVVEVAAILTEDDLNELFTYETVVGFDVSARVDSQAFDMHKKSGLWDLVLHSDRSIDEVDRDLYELVSPLLRGKTPYLGGSSVHFDRGFINRYMPYTNSLLSHRHFDVSTIKILFSMVTGNDTSELPPIKRQTKHRALSDIRDSIDAARIYLRWLHEVAPHFP